MEWLREQKYRRIEDASEDEMNLLLSKVNRCPWRQTFHVQPVMGLLNDPNGFSFLMENTTCFINGTLWARSTV